MRELTDSFQAPPLDEEELDDPGGAEIAEDGGGPGLDEGPPALEGGAGMLEGGMIALEGGAGVLEGGAVVLEGGGALAGEVGAAAARDWAAIDGLGMASSATAAIVAVKNHLERMATSD